MCRSGRSARSDARDDPDAAARPAVLLADVRREVLGPETAGEHLRDVHRAPTALVQLERDGEVLGERSRREPADGLEGAAPEHDVRAAAEHRLVGVLAAGDRPEEQRLLAPRCAGDPARGGVGVVLRGLHVGDGVVGELGQRLDQQVGVGDVIAVEDEHVRRVGPAEGVVDVAGLGALVQRAADVADAVAAGELDHLLAVAVVEQGDVDAAPCNP